MNHISYSIIIPHKNRFQLLIRCLKSIPCRKDIEIIIIDDNSNNTTIEELNSLIFEGSNVTIFFTKNGKGAGHARNVGIDHAKGKWIIFSDCDDVFSENLNNILDSCIGNPNDIIFFDVDCIHESTFDKVSSPLLDRKSVV